MKKTGILRTLLIIMFATLSLFSCKYRERADETREALRIKPWTENNRYWQYRGQPVLLLGGSDQDNLFNHPNMGPDGLEAHLDLLVSVGGNYVRNTMSSRDRIDPESNLYNDDNLYPFYLDEATGLYDLERWNDEYWKRFSSFLQKTEERDIIVQIEIWDRWDYSGDRQPNYMAYGWSAHPFNPKNNKNYSVGETNLDTVQWQGHRIFRTIPELDSVPLVLGYQEALVDKLLSTTFEFDHILYCISNESDASEEWSRYWAEYILKKAAEAKISIELTEMWNAWDLTNSMHGRTFNHPEIYSFVDISQNNHQLGQTHWDNMQAAMGLLAEVPRPVNNIKIYGGDQHGGGLEEGVNKFWRSILGGCASARFHRPGKISGYYGAGLSELAQKQIKSATMFLESFDIFMAEADTESRLLGDRSENEAYLAYIPDRQYAVYFVNGGSVTLDLSEVAGPLRIRWLDIGNSEWALEDELPGSENPVLKTPGEGQWIALITRQ